ncbi:MAG: nodulation protein NodH [Roseobacter sp.]
MQNVKSFVIFAEMRTGSNFLETNLNALAGVSCHGEAFNPHFIGYPSTPTLLGMTHAARDENPQVLLDMIQGSDGLGGFRYFHDHDPRILDAVLRDPTCAKVILSRNPVDSYVSWKIAQATGQWKLTDVKRRRAAKAHFDAADFEAHVGAMETFQQHVTRQLQTTGQTAFHLTYDDLQSVDVINGLAAFLGIEDRLANLDQSLKVQNPKPVGEKVSNPEEMEAALAARRGVDLGHLPSFEARRVAAVPTYVRCVKAPLMYMPLRSGPYDAVTSWMAALDGVTRDALPTKMSQKTVRQWKRAHKGHRSFTVLRHPVARAHHAFCSHILGTGPQVYAAIRQTLVRRYDLPLSEDGPDASYDTVQHRTAFKAFLRFLGPNISGQTAIRVDAAWCTQSQAISGFGNFALPDLILREDEIQTQLPELAKRTGYDGTIGVPDITEDQPFSLADIYDAEIETLAASAYQRDYMQFGFKAWN